MTLVQENIDWSGTVKSILLVDKQKISDKQLTKRTELQNERGVEECHQDRHSDLEAEIISSSQDTRRASRCLKVIGNEMTVAFELQQTT